MARDGKCILIKTNRNRFIFCSFSFISAFQPFSGISDHLTTLIHISSCLASRIMGSLTSQMTEISSKKCMFMTWDQAISRPHKPERWCHNFWATLYMIKIYSLLFWIFYIPQPRWELSTKHHVVHSHLFYITIFLTLWIISIM